MQAIAGLRNIRATRVIGIETKKIGGNINNGFPIKRKKTVDKWFLEKE